MCRQIHRKDIVLTNTFFSMFLLKILSKIHVSSSLHIFVSYAHMFLPFLLQVSYFF